MKEKFRPYIQAMPDIFRYIIVIKLILFVMMSLIGEIVKTLLRSVGRIAVTSGDWKFLYTTWQGILILVLSLAVLYICVALELNGKIALCSMLVNDEDVSVRECLGTGFKTMVKLFSPVGLLVVLYISFIAPILGLGFSTTPTEGLYIPTFITAFIQESALYSSLLGIIIPILLIIGIANLYILHGIVLDGLSAADSGRQSYRIMRNNYKNYLKENALFFLTIAIFLALFAVVCLLIPLALIQLIPMPQACSRFLIVFIITIGSIMYLFADLFIIPLYLLKMTRLFYLYRNDGAFTYCVSEKKQMLSNRVLAVLCSAAIIAAVISQCICFDSWYPATSNVDIVAHRAGGIEAPENTIEGLEKAYQVGASGSEIDIKRTKDGFYVLNHDNTFKRTAGEKRKPQEMDLQEVKALRVDGASVPEFEEVLAASKGRLMLFAELKGSTADRKMADDAVKLIHKYNMEDECVLISLKYDLIDYIETKYPEIQTGFLTFLSFGNTADLTGDYIGLEAESATAYRVNSIHKRGKKVLVWTVNSKSSQKRFLCSDADGIITDNITQAVKIREELAARSDFARMLDKVKIILSSTM